MPVYILPVSAVILFILAGIFSHRWKKEDKKPAGLIRKISSISGFTASVILAVMTVNVIKAPSVPEKSGIKIISTDIAMKDVYYRTGRKLDTTLLSDKSFIDAHNRNISITYTDSIYNKKTLYQSDVIDIKKDPDLASDHIRINSTLTKCHSGMFWKYAVKYVIFVPER